MVFYLLAECANESLGLKIKELKVTHKWETKALSEGTMTWNASEGKGAAHIEKQDFTVGVSFLGGKKDKPDKPKEPDPSTTPGETPVPIKPNPKTDPKETPQNTPQTPKNPPETGSG